MMQNDANNLFVGMKINDKLREQLDDTKVSMKPFFNNNDPEYLQIVQMDNDDYIGKIVENGVSLEILNNILLNIKTMLRMIIPKFSLSEDALKIFAHTPKPARIFYEGQ